MTIPNFQAWLLIARRIGFDGLRLFEDLVREVEARAEEIARAARAMAVIDVAAALAELAAVRRWCRPEVDSSLEFRIEGGRHPVVEAALDAAQEGPFVANDCDVFLPKCLG